MQTMAIAEAKNNFSAMLHAVEAGEDIVLTRHGKPVARVVPANAPSAPTRVGDDTLRREAMGLLNAFRANVKPGPHLPWKELRDAGRTY
jgi:prevent-host-death family protein